MSLCECYSVFVCVFAQSPELFLGLDASADASERVDSNVLGYGLVALCFPEHDLHAPAGGVSVAYAVG